MANKPHNSGDEPKKMPCELTKEITSNFCEFGAICKSPEEETIVRKKDIEKSHSQEIVEDAGTSKTKESDPSIACTPQEELPLDLLKRITNDFSNKQKLGENEFGTAYKAIQDGREIVVKRLKEESPFPREEVFMNEIRNIMALRHENIVRLVGYCTEPPRKVVQINGKYTFEKTDESFLCYEYLPKGNLGKYIAGDSSKSDWAERFKIINGICDGLHFLHTEKQIIHMDLQPKNVLLDYNMVAKIAGFGMSRIISKEQTQEKTQKVVGSYGYIAPEYLYEGEISAQTDIYSLGLTIIEIVTKGRNSNIPSPSDPSARIFIEKVREEWIYDHIVSSYPSVDAKSLTQIVACIDIGLQCVEIDRKKRPSIEDIVNKIS